MAVDHELDEVDRIQAQWRRERPDLDVEAMGLIGRISRISLHLRQEMDTSFKRHGLNSAGFDVLATLRRSGPPFELSPGDLLATMMITSGTLTNRVDQMIAAGMVSRRANPEDGRGMLIALTEHGLATVDAAVTEHVETQARLVAGLPEEDRRALVEILRRWSPRGTS